MLQAVVSRCFGLHAVVTDSAAEGIQSLEYQTPRARLLPPSGRAFSFVVNHCGGACNVKALAQLNPKVAA